MVSPSIAPPLQLLINVPKSHRMIGPSLKYLVGVGPLPRELLLGNPQPVEILTFNPLSKFCQQSTGDFSEVAAPVARFLLPDGPNDSEKRSDEWAGVFVHLRFKVSADREDYVDAYEHPTSWQVSCILSPHPN